MKHIKEILEDLGFNPEAPKGAQEAFIKHLIRIAGELEPQSRDPRPSETDLERSVETNLEERAFKMGEQLSFHFEGQNNESFTDTKPKKVS